MGSPKRGVNVALKPVDRSNWKAMIQLRTRAEQETFVASPLLSLAGCYVKRYGDEFEYAPFVICDGDRVVGYVTFFGDPKSADNYWVDDILIDASEQGKGYGRAAMLVTIKMMLARFPKCRTIQLTCFRANTSAAALYESLGFKNTGALTPEVGEPRWALSGAELEKYR
ncbi:MAG: GNAT family N-acetyltransferase [Candidatus Binataceae bacterium]